MRNRELIALFLALIAFLLFINKDYYQLKEIYFDDHEIKQKLVQNISFDRAFIKSRKQNSISYFFEQDFYNNKKSFINRDTLSATSQHFENHWLIERGSKQYSSHDTSKLIRVFLNTKYDLANNQISLNKICSFFEKPSFEILENNFSLINDNNFYLLEFLILANINKDYFYIDFIDSNKNLISRIFLHTEYINYDLRTHSYPIFNFTNESYILSANVENKQIRSEDNMAQKLPDPDKISSISVKLFLLTKNPNEIQFGSLNDFQNNWDFYQEEKFKKDNSETTPSDSSNVNAEAIFKIYACK